MTRARLWYDLRLRPQSERAPIFWPKAQQYRHLAVWNQDSLPGSNNLYDVRPLGGVDVRLLWAILNSTVVALSKHQFGRMAGIEGSLKTEVLDVNMMLVPDPRNAAPHVTARIFDAIDRVAERLAARTLIDEFEMDDRIDLDAAVLELLGVAGADRRTALRRRIYAALSEQYASTRAREVIAQHDRPRSGRRGFSPGEIADDIWQEVSPDLDLLEFPQDFVSRTAALTHVDLPSGGVEVGLAMTETGSHLRAGTLRVGGPTGAVLDVGSAARARFLASAAECGHYGPIDVPNDASAESAVTRFESYRRDLQARFAIAATERTRDARRQRPIAAQLMRKALTWRRPQA